MKRSLLMYLCVCHPWARLACVTVWACEQQARLQSVEGHRGKHSWRRAICARIANMAAELSLRLAAAGAVSTTEKRESQQNVGESGEQVTKSIGYFKEVETEYPVVHCEDVSDEMKK
mmetsp:Transcript_76311/g.247528  ORF Transcript_76311/g.247528 Transcript_76311/m.247528 type:complete len:117 (+) Transcript_76311:121-471(+)